MNLVKVFLRSEEHKQLSGVIMEILAVLFIVFLGLIFLKIIGLFLNVGIFLISIPLKILAFLLSTIFVVFVLAPLGLLTILVATPLFFIITPLLLFGIGVIFVLRNL